MSAMHIKPGVSLTLSKTPKLSDVLKLEDNKVKVNQEMKLRFWEARKDCENKEKILFTGKHTEHGRCHTLKFFISRT